MNILIIEDVITTGKSILECAEIIQRSKAKLLGYACIINRSNKKNLIKTIGFKELKNFLLKKTI